MPHLAAALTPGHCVIWCCAISPHLAIPLHTPITAILMPNQVKWQQQLGDGDQVPITCFLELNFLLVLMPALEPTVGLVYCKSPRCPH